MPSFDVVSEVDIMEVKNALDQAQKELANRFDFRDAKAEIVLEKESIKLSAVDQFKINALEEIVLGKLARRNVSLKNIERKDADISPLGHARKELKLKQGLETDIAKTIVQAIRDTKLKVQAQIQDRQVRVTGKNRDDLQTVIAALRGKEFPVALNYTNFRA
ncbi:MAG: YajQ family cyclic di-GMP-binding protein [Methylacidiphilales bacterium]|nr:YajQ family cyclic di-GMP-binding protein [Candidatus Methylacidiphilales bacterium]